MLSLAPRAVPALENRLLASLPPAERQALLDDAEPVYLLPGTCLCELGSALTHVYFPVRGLVSLGYAAENGDNVELALVGLEGMVGVGVFMGATRTMHRAVVRLFCAAYRAPAAAVRERFARGGPFQQALLHYALSLMTQISRASVCSRHHSVEQRLCRALLQSLERVGGAALPLTHDVLADLVGARRQGISEAAQQLRDDGIISYGRGSLRVLDRVRLAARACDCGGVRV